MPTRSWWRTARKATKRRCGKCGRRYPGFDHGQGRWRWRALGLGTVRAYLEADGCRAACPSHRVVVAQVPWTPEASLKRAPLTGSWVLG